MENGFSNKGQTAIEYIFLLLVMVSILTSVLPRIKDYVLADCSSGNSKSFICQAGSIYNLDDLRFFRIPK